MSNELVLPQNFAAPSTAFAGSKVDANDLAAGIGASFPVVSYKGKVWSIKYRGQIHQLLDKPTQPGHPAQPIALLPLAIVKASPVTSKIFYENGFNDQSNGPPDCWSTNGMAPDPASPKKQCDTCAACPRNVWGSKMLPSGKAGKQCGDSRRLAVVPAHDIKNEFFGGPMLLRVPAGSLQDMASYSNALQARGYPYFAVATGFSFDHTVAHPKFVFTPLRGFNDAEAAMILEHQESEQVKRILSEPVTAAQHEGDLPPAGTIAAGAAAPAGTPSIVTTPVHVGAAAPLPTQPPAAPELDPSYQYTPDNKFRWKAGMPAWEAVPEPAPAPPPVPVAPPVPVPPPPPVAPVAPVAPTAPVMPQPAAFVPPVAPTVAAPVVAPTTFVPPQPATFVPPVAPTAPVAPAIPPQPEMQVVQPVAPPTFTPPPTAPAAAPVEDEKDRMIRALQEKLNAQPAPTGKRTRRATTPAPSPTPTAPVMPTAPQATVPQPPVMPTAAPPIPMPAPPQAAPVMAAPVAPTPPAGENTPVMQDINAQLEALL